MDNSVKCEICGCPQSFGHFVVCPVCEKTLCDYCLNHNHDCYDIYTDEYVDDGPGDWYE